LSIKRASEILGVRRAALSDFLNGHAALSPEMALRIKKAFGVSMEMLLRMQAWPYLATVSSSWVRDAATDAGLAPSLQNACPRDEIDLPRYGPLSPVHRRICIAKLVPAPPI
jgi:addiction module HigA family antidote